MLITWEIALIEYSLTFKKFLAFRKRNLHSFFPVSYSLMHQYHEVYVRSFMLFVGPNLGALLAERADRQTVGRQKRVIIGLPVD